MRQSITKRIVGDQQGAAAHEGRRQSGLAGAGCAEETDYPGTDVDARSRAGRAGCVSRRSAGRELIQQQMPDGPLKEFPFADGRRWRGG